MFVNRLHEEAHITLKEGNLEKAIELYTKALDETKSHPEILSDRGVAYLHANDKEKCFADMELARDLEPKRAYRYSSLAYAKNHFKDLDGAISDYEIAVELDPDDAIAHNNLGLLLEQKGYKDASEKRFARADELSKQEDHLIEMMDDIEKDKTQETETEKKETPKLDPTIEVIEPKIEKEEKAGKEFTKIFTKRSQFKEFLSFVKNGFKIK